LTVPCHGQFDRIPARQKWGHSSFYRLWLLRTGFPARSVRLRWAAHPRIVLVCVEVQFNPFWLAFTGWPRLAGGPRHFRVHTRVAGSRRGDSQAIMPQSLASRPRPCQSTTRSWQELQLPSSKCNFHIRPKAGPRGPQGGPKVQNMKFFPRVLPHRANCPIWPTGGIRVKYA
jgi:hypothetical protein